MTEIVVAEKKKGDFVDSLTGFFTNAIDKTDEQLALERVNELRQSNPNADVDTLVEMLVKKKAIQTATVGAATAAAASVPGLGTMAALLFGVPLDIGLTFKWQAELVLEIAAVHDHLLTQDEKRNAILIVTGLSAGAAQLAKAAGRRAGQQITQHATRKIAARAIPVVGAIFSGGTNAITTYVIGRRAHAYFSLGPDELEDWGESVRAITGVDERKVITSVSEGATTAWKATTQQVQKGAGTVTNVGKSIVSRSHKAPDLIEVETSP